MTINVALVTHDAVILGCDSISSETKYLLDPSDAKRALDGDGQPIDVDGQPAVIWEQRGKPTARGKCQYETAAAPEQRGVTHSIAVVAALEDQEARQQHQRRKQIGRPAKEQISDIGEPGSRRTHAILHELAVPGNAEGRIGGVITHEREKENDGKARAKPQRGLP